jgi:NitT/TauT family transport system substrate-binding protein
MRRRVVLATCWLVVGVLVATCGPASGGGAPGAGSGGATAAGGNPSAAGGSAPAARSGAPGGGSAGGQAAGTAPGTGAASATPDHGAALPPLPGKVTASYSSVSGTFVPLWLAAESGLFQKNGLDVEVTYIASGTTSMQSLLAGDLQFIVASSAEPAAAYLAGAPTRIVAGWFPALSALFMADPSITRPEQLRGKAVGITRFGGQPHVAARLALTAWGMDPDDDVQYLQLGGTPEILAAMQQGVVVAGAFAPPTNVRAQRMGFRILGDLAQMGIPYLSGVLSSQQPYLEANPEPSRRFVRAIVEAIKLSLTDDEATRAAMGKYTRTDDVELLDETIKYYRQVVAKVPYPSLDGLRTVLSDLAEDQPRARTTQPQELVNTAALEQLEREGFFKYLYGE